jgi:ketosteroid isomerase-like protein
MVSMTPSTVTAVADRMFAAIERGEVDALAAMWSDDVVVWRLGGGRERDRPRALAVIEWFVANTTDRHYEVIDRHLFDGGFVQQHVVHATAASGAPVTFRACLIVTIAGDGLITRIDEYLDPADLAALATG